MQTFGEKVIAFNRRLKFDGQLPAGISMMNPFRESKLVMGIAAAFYKKYYDDYAERNIILGINPGRFGGGVTGIPFTDTRRLTDHCKIPYNGKATHEPSSVFVYEVIDAYGGPEKFYEKFYINSVCPLGFTSVLKGGKDINYNYYDSKELTSSVSDFIIKSIYAQIKFGINQHTCFCFGTGKNEKYLKKLNDEFNFFEKIIALEHPRFVMQYKSKSRHVYIDKYLQAFASV